MKALLLLLCTSFVFVFLGCSQAQDRNTQMSGVAHQALTSWQDYKFLSVPGEELYCKEADTVTISIIDLEVYSELDAFCNSDEIPAGNYAHMDINDDMPDCGDGSLPAALPADDFSTVQTCIPPNCIKPANVLIMTYSTYSVGCRCDGTVCSTY